MDNTISNWSYHALSPSLMGPQSAIEWDTQHQAENPQVQGKAQGWGHYQNNKQLGKRW